MNQTANGVITSYEVLADMLESIESFVDRLRIYTLTSGSTPEVDKVVVKLMVQLISALALVTKKLKKRRLRESFLADAITYSARRSRVKWVKEFFCVKDINAARKELERLLQEENRAVGTQTFKVVEGK